MKVHTDASLALPRSHSGIFLFAASDKDTMIPLDWASKHQKIGSTSSCASETISAHEGAMLALPTTSFFFKQSMELHCDNRALLHNINRGYSERLSYLQRALKLRTTFLHDCVRRGLIVPLFVPTDLDLADGMTKPLAYPGVRTHAEAQGITFGPNCGKTTQQEIEAIKLDE